MSTANKKMKTKKTPNQQSKSSGSGQLDWSRKQLITMSINWQVDHSIKVDNFWQDWVTAFGPERTLEKNVAKKFIDLLNETNGECDPLTFDLDDIASNNASDAGDENNHKENGNKETTTPTAPEPKRKGKRKNQKINVSPMISHEEPAPRVSIITNVEPIRKSMSMSALTLISDSENEVNDKKKKKRNPVSTDAMPENNGNNGDHEPKQTMAEEPKPKKAKRGTKKVKQNEQPPIPTRCSERNKNKRQ